MDFLQPLMLYGIALVSAPLILHLLSRRRVREVVFPAVTFLLGTRRRSMRMLTLRQWLVLLCRMLAIGLIAAAAALPLIKNFDPGIPGTRTPVAVHILIDNTPSMGWRKAGVSYLDRARAAAEKIVAGAADEDIVDIEPACGKPFSASAASGKDVLIQRLDEIDVASCGADMSQKIELAAARLAGSKAGQKNLVVLSDFQASSFRSGIPGPSPEEPVVVTAIDFSGGESRRNIRIESLDTPLFPLVGEDIPICYRLSADGEFDTGAVAALFIEQTKRGEHEVDFDNDNKAEGCFTMAFGETGAAWGKLVVSGDDMTADNTRFFTIDINRSIEALVVAREEDARNAGTGVFYIVRALHAASGAGPGESSIKIDFAAPDKLGPAMLPGSGVLILPATTELDEEKISMISGFAAGGGGVFVAADGSGSTVEMISKTLFGGGIEVAPARAGAADGDDAPDGSDGYFTFSDISRGHPLFTLGNGRSLIQKIDEIWFSRPAKLGILNRETGAVAYLSNGAPFLVERRLGSGRIVLCASSLKPTRTNFSLSPSFVPFILQVSRYLSRGYVEEADDFIAGREVVIVLEGVEKNETIRLRNLETGDEMGMKRMGQGTRAPFRVEGRPGPGVYAAVKNQDDLLDFITVNNDPAEGDLKPVGKDGWPDGSESGDFVRMDSSRFIDFEKLNERSFGNRSASVWFPFLLLGVVFLLAESYLANRR